MRNGVMYALFFLKITAKQIFFCAWVVTFLGFMQSAWLREWVKSNFLGQKYEKGNNFLYKNRTKTSAWCSLLFA
jgi:hypothetical protein